MAPRISLVTFAAHFAISFFAFASGELDVILTRYQAPVDALCVGNNRTAAYGVPGLQFKSESANLLTAAGAFATDADFLYIGSSPLASQRSCIPDALVDVCIQNSPAESLKKISLAELPAGVQDSSYVVSLLSQSQIVNQDVHVCASNDYPRDMAVEGAAPALTVSKHSSNVTFVGSEFQATIPSFIVQAVSSYLSDNYQQKTFSRVYGAVLVTRIPGSVTPKWVTSYLIYRLLDKKHSSPPEIVGNLFYASSPVDSSATATSSNQGSTVSWGKIAHRRLLQDVVPTDTVALAGVCMRWVWDASCRCYKQMPC